MHLNCNADYNFLCFRAGIKLGDVITNIDGKNIKCNDDLLAAVRGKSEVKFIVHRSGDAKGIIVKQILIRADEFKQQRM